MQKSYTRFTYLGFTLFAALVSGCDDSSPGGSSITETNTYSTTSTRGDYAEWTLTGSNLVATWQVIDDIGQIDYTITITAICGSANTFGIRSCTIDTSACTDGVSVCPSAPSGSFDMMDAPGVAMFVITDADTIDEQLHVGFVKDDGACADDVAGDYTFIHTSLGSTENFGMYRSDSNATNILHSDFGFETPDGNTISQTVAYRTGTESEVLTDDGCSNGVRKRTVGGNSIRMMMTASGLFILDFPAGQGGLVSFNVTNAASLADFASKSFGGVTFPDNAIPEPISAVFDAVSGSTVDFTATTQFDIMNLTMMDLGTLDSMTNPAYPDFTVAPAGYDTSDLSISYATPDDIPGLFKIDGLFDDGRVIMAAMKFGTKVIAVGMIYNYRMTTDINPNTGVNFTADGLYNTGNFILFER